MKCKHIFDTVLYEVIPQVIPHIDVLMAVRFLRRVESKLRLHRFLWEFMERRDVYADDYGLDNGNCALRNILQSWIYAWTA